MHHFLEQGGGCSDPDGGIDEGLEIADRADHDEGGGEVYADVVCRVVFAIVGPVHLASHHD